MVTFDSTDLDNAVSESGVAHENVQNTEHDNASKLKQGYDYENFNEITPTPAACWPLHEDSGSTAYDLAGNNNGTYNGPTLGQPGILGSTSPDFDGNDDLIDCGDISLVEGTRSFTFTAWVNPDSLSDSENTRIFENGNSSSYYLWLDGDRSITGYDVVSGFYDGSNFNDVGVGNISTGSWSFVAATYNGSSLTGYVNASQTESISVSTSVNSTSEPFQIGHKYNESATHLNGRLSDVRIYQTALTQSQLQTFYDVVATAGTLTSPYKSV